MLGHDHVPCDHKLVTHANGFQLLFEDDTGLCGVEKGFSAVAAKREKVKLTRVLIANEALRHAREVYSHPPFANSAKGGAPTFLGSKGWAPAFVQD